MEGKAAAKSFQDLVVWRKAHELVISVYRLSDMFPRAELFGLTSQLRRSAVSVPANIAEGFRKRGRADKGRYLNIAHGSLDEVLYLLILANDLGYAETSVFRAQAEEVGRMLGAYYHAILDSRF